MNNYQRGKNAAREQAIAWQANFAEQSQPWGEIAAEQRQLEQLARRYGLVREFRENAII
jgi:hypothetical protein